MLLVCLGGGGLLAGCATATAALSPGHADHRRRARGGRRLRQRSLAAGERVRIEVPRTIADGQQLPIPGELTFPVIQKHVHEVVTVSDAEIVDAMRLLFERAKTVTEPSGACAFAALLAGKVDAAGLRVGRTLSRRQRHRAAARFAELRRALTLAALALVLASAALHAGWNALVAGAEDTHATTAVALLTGVAGRSPSPPRSPGASSREASRTSSPRPRSSSPTSRCSPPSTRAPTTPSPIRSRAARRRCSSC